MPNALIIEDNEDLAFLYQQFLELADFKVEHAKNGWAAKDKIKDTQPDLILLDLNLPGASGDTLLTTIRTAEHLNDTKVIVISADDQMARHLKHEPDLILLKPAPGEQIMTFAKRLTTDGDT